MDNVTLLDGEEDLFSKELELWGQVNGELEIVDGVPDPVRPVSSPQTILLVCVFTYVRTYLLNYLLTYSLTSLVKNLELI